MLKETRKCLDYDANEGPQLWGVRRYGHPGQHEGMDKVGIVLAIIAISAVAVVLLTALWVWASGSRRTVER